MLPELRIRIVGVSEFASVREASADPLLGDEHDTVLSVGGNLLLYGDGGAGKTTLMIDAVAHLGAGLPWLGLPVPRPVRSLAIENEGSRGKFREKMKRKLGSWEGPDWSAQVDVLEDPWAGFSLDDEGLVVELAALIKEGGYDLLVAGPGAEIGMEGAGTPADVSTFDRRVSRLRALLDRPLAFGIIHHESKSGDVSGAWSRWPDTLAHLRAEGRERARLHWRKVRHSSALHDTKITLAWLTPSEGFAVIDTENELAVERANALESAIAWIVDYVSERPGRPRTIVEKAYAEKHGRGARALARQAIDTALERRANGEVTNSLATGPGTAPNGMYLYPASLVVSPFADPLFGEHGEQVSPVSQTSLEDECSPLATLPKEMAADGEQRARSSDNDDVELASRRNESDTPNAAREVRA